MRRYSLRPARARDLFVPLRWRMPVGLALMEARAATKIALSGIKEGTRELVAAMGDARMEILKFGDALRNYLRAEKRYRKHRRTRSRRRKARAIQRRRARRGGAG